MRVVQICNEIPPAPSGGIGSITFDLAPELVEKGVHLSIVGIYPPQVISDVAAEDTETQSPFQVVRLESKSHQLPFPLRVAAERIQLSNFLKALYKKTPFDLILADDYEGFVPFTPPGKSQLVVRLSGSNIVYDDLQGNAGLRPIWWAERRMLRRANAWIGVSQFFINETAKRIPRRSGQVRSVIPNPVNTTLFSPSVGEDLSVNGRIVFHNSLGTRKGIFDLFKAIPTVFDAFPGAHLEIYGSSPDFEKTKAELSGTLSPSHQSRVSFLGRVDRESTLPAALERAHVTCYPSHLETFGISPVEAMAMKRIVIYTDTGPGREIIDDGVTGFLCRPRDPENLASCLIKALQLNQGARLAMGEAARAKAVSRFDRTVVVAQYLDMFKSLLPHPSSPVK